MQILEQNIVKTKSSEKISPSESIESNLITEKPLLHSTNQSESLSPKDSPNDDTEDDKDIEEIFEKGKSSSKVFSESDISPAKPEVGDNSCKGDEVIVSESSVLEDSSAKSLSKDNEVDSKSDIEKLVPSQSPSTAVSNKNSDKDISEIKAEAVKVEDKAADDNLVKVKDEKIIDIVKSELFSEPLPIKKQPVKLDNSASERNEDNSNKLRNR